MCYTGTTPGSTAVYHCGEGYGLSSESGVLVCQYNGVWNGISPTCQSQYSQDREIKYYKCTCCISFSCVQVAVF